MSACPNCGADQPSAAGFCGRCGANLLQDEDRSQFAPVENSRAAYRSHDRTTQRFRVLSIVMDIEPCHWRQVSVRMEQGVISKGSHASSRLGELESLGLVKVVGKVEVEGHSNSLYRTTEAGRRVLAGLDPMPALPPKYRKNESALRQAAQNVMERWDALHPQDPVSMGELATAVEALREILDA